MFAPIYLFAHTSQGRTPYNCCGPPKRTTSPQRIPKPNHDTQRRSMHIMSGAGKKKGRIWRGFPPSSRPIAGNVINWGGRGLPSSHFLSLLPVRDTPHPCLFPFLLYTAVIFRSSSFRPKSTPPPLRHNPLQPFYPRGPPEK